MGRKPNPRGKDKTRTIQLDGDVADIADELATKSQLSAVLSQLLRESFGIVDNVAVLERQLVALTDERKLMQQREEELIQELTRAKDAVIHQQTTIRPALEHRREILVSRIAELHAQELRALDKETRARKARQLHETQNQLDDVMRQLKEMDS